MMVLSKSFSLFVFKMTVLVMLIVIVVEYIPSGVHRHIHVYTRRDRFIDGYVYTCIQLYMCPCACVMSVFM